MCLTPDLRLLVTSCSDGGTYYWHMERACKVEEEEFVHRDWSTSVALLGAGGGGGGGGGEQLGSAAPLRVVSAGLDMDIVVRPLPRSVAGLLEVG